MIYYKFELVSIKDFIMDKGKNFFQTIDSEDLEMEGQDLTDAIDTFSASATQKGCYIRSIEISGDITGEVVHDTIYNWLSSKSDPLDHMSIMEVIMDLDEDNIFGWSYRDPADSYEDVSIIAAHVVADRESERKAYMAEE